MKHHKSNELAELQKYIQSQSEKFTLADWCSPESLNLTLQQVRQLLVCMQDALPAHLADTSKLRLAFQASSATSDDLDITCKFASIQIYTQFSDIPVLTCGAQIYDEKIVVEDITIRPLAETRKFSLLGHDVPLIIIVDDDLALVKLLNRWITTNESQHYQTLCVHNGDDALKVYQANYHCACIFMDIQMPEPHMDGLQATQKIREFEKSHNLPKKPIILMSAAVLDNDVLEKYDVQALCQKPITKKHCLETLDKIVNNYLTEEYSESQSYFM